VDDLPIDLSNLIDLEGLIDRFSDWDRGIAIAEIELRSLSCKAVELGKHAATVLNEMDALDGECSGDA
jgi:hypothetical protein